MELTQEEKTAIAIVQGYSAGVSFDAIVYVFMKKHRRTEFYIKRLLKRLESTGYITHDGFRFFFTGKVISIDV